MYKTFLYIFIFVINSLSSLAQFDSSYLRYNDKFIADSIETLSGYEKMHLFKKICWNNRIYRPEAAINYGLKALKLAEDLSEKEEETILYNYLGVVNRNLNNYPLALDYYFKAQNKAEEYGLVAEKAYAYNNIGDIYNREESYLKAAKYMNDALALFAQIEDTTGLAYCNNQLGLVMRNMKKNSEALSYFFKSLKLRKELADSSGIAPIFNNVGEIYLAQNKLKKAKKFFLRGLGMEQSFKNILGVCFSYVNISKYYIKVDSLNLAVKYLNKSYKLSHDYGFYEKSVEASQLLSEIYFKKRNFELAYKYSKINKVLSDNLNKEENSNKIIRIEMKYKYEQEIKEQKAIEIKNQKKSNMYILILILSALFFLAVAISLYIVGQYRRKTNIALNRRNSKIIIQQRELRKYSNELNEINKTKDKFFSIIAHDLKSPFNAILGFSRILVTEIEDENFDNIEQYSKLILDSSQQNYDLLINLLEWARSQTEKIEFEPESINIKEFTESIINLFSSLALQKQILITSSIDNVNVFSDKNMLNTILRNLVSNAIKFTHSGKKIEINVKKIETGVEFSVKDEGIGIKEEDISKLFRVDTNFSKLGTNQETGTGLGLVLCKDFVEKHNGNIWIETLYGEGSTFYFTIPDNEK